MTNTPRLAMPFLAAGQAQKEFLHNEALQILDVVAACAVEEGPRAAPPSDPVIGSCYILDSAPSGAWAGQAHCIAAFTSGGWRFISPPDGMSTYVRTSGVIATFRDGAWDVGQVRANGLVIGDQQVVGTRGAPINGPSGGATVDGEARSTIEAILTALRQHGLIAAA